MMRIQVGTVTTAIAMINKLIYQSPACSTDLSIGGMSTDLLTM